MSTEERVQKSDSQNGRSTSDRAIGVANKVISQVEDQALRGATAISQMAHRTADQIDRASDYLQQAGMRTLDTAKGKAKDIRESAGKHPLSVVLAATAIGFGMGSFISRKRAS